MIQKNEEPIVVGIGIQLYMEKCPNRILREKLHLDIHEHC